MSAPSAESRVGVLLLLLSDIRRRPISPSGVNHARTEPRNQLSLHRLTRRQAILSGAAAGIGLLLSARRGFSQDAGNTTDGQPKSGGTLRWALESDIDTLDPVFTDRAVTWELTDHLYDSLFIFDATERPRPCSLGTSASATTIRHTPSNLRPEATFETGQAVTPADVLASLQRWGKKATTGISLFSQINSLEARRLHVHS